MRLAVIGSRNCYDYETIKRKLDYIHDNKFMITSIVSGGAKGADSFGARWADENSVDKDIYLPDWNQYGKRAGFIRNEQIVVNCDVLIAFWDGKSRGTMNSLDLCEEHGIKYLVINI